jgi:hypothetical protein
MIDPRIYRAALIPALLALIVVAFSLRDRPRPVGTTLAPIAFDGARAWQDLQGPDGLAARYPDRHTGGAGDEQLAVHVSDELRRLGFDVRTRTRRVMTVHGRRDVQTVIAERTGTLDGRILVLAHRDAAVPGSVARLSATEGLLELARVFGAPRRTQRTLTLVSTSGSDGTTGTRGLRSLLGSQRVEAALVLGDLASRATRRPFVAGWSDDLGMAPLRLQRTVQEALRAEIGGDPGGPRALVQWMRFAAPATLTEQGPLNDAGIPAVLISASGERGPTASAAVSQARLQTFGSAALRAITALDNGPAWPPVSSAELVVHRKVVPSWAIRLLVGALILAPLVATVDALARVRRHHDPVAPWLRRIAIGALPLVAAAAFARVLGLVGLVDAPGGPVSPEALPAQAAGLVAVVLFAVLAWLLGRPLLRRLRAPGGEGEDPAGPASATGVLLVLCGVTALIWVSNPYAAALLLPALHVWLFALAPELRPRRLVGLGLVALTLIPFAILVAVVMTAFGLGPVGTVWFGLLLVAGGHASPLSWVLWSVVASCVAGAAAIAWRGRVRVEPPRGGAITVRGPIGYAGPGSLGGVESGLRR